MPKKPVAPEIKKKLKDVEVTEGETATLLCTVTGVPEPDAEWFFEGKLIKDENRHRYLFEENDAIGLEIRKVRLEDEGEYKLVAFNKSGEASSTCELLVNGTSSVSGRRVVNQESPKVESTEKVLDTAEFQKKAAGRLFTPAARNKKKKQKLPIQRDGIIAENPEQYYNFGEVLGQGKFSVVKECVRKDSGDKFAAKIIKFDKDSLKFAIREYDMMTDPKLDHKNLVKLHEAYLVRKYLILIMDLCSGKTLLDQVSHRHTLNEEDVSSIIRQLCETLANIHSKNLIHLDVRPTNIRFMSGGSRELKLLDYNSMRYVPNKKAGAVVDVIGDTEFCAPELLVFEPVMPGSDMWSVAVITYILLSGISPFYYEDEDMVLKSVQQVNWTFVPKESPNAFNNISADAKDFIKRCFIRIPEMRMKAEEALNHPWLDPAKAAQRKLLEIKPQSLMISTDERLLSEEEEDYVCASLVFRTFDEEEYESPEESDDED